MSDRERRERQRKREGDRIGPDPVRELQTRLRNQEIARHTVELLAYLGYQPACELLESDAKTPSVQWTADHDHNFDWWVEMPHQDTVTLSVFVLTILRIYAEQIQDQGGQHIHVENGARAIAKWLIEPLSVTPLWELRRKSNWAPLESDEPGIMSFDALDCIILAHEGGDAWTREFAYLSSFDRIPVLNLGAQSAKEDLYKKTCSGMIEWCLSEEGAKKIATFGDLHPGKHFCNNLCHLENPTHDCSEECDFFDRVFDHTTDPATLETTYCGSDSCVLCKYTLQEQITALDDQIEEDFQEEVQREAPGPSFYDVDRPTSLEESPLDFYLGDYAHEAPDIYPDDEELY